MDKLKYIKLENEDGTYSSSIPLAVDSDHVDVNGNTLTNELNAKAVKAEVNEDLSNLATQVNALASGSPAGVYATVTALTTADPDHSKIYIVTTDGHWYYYNNGWTDGGLYQSSGIADDSINTSMINTDTIDYLLDDSELLDKGIQQNVLVTKFVSGLFNNNGNVYNEQSSNNFVRTEKPLKFPTDREYKIKAKSGYMFLFSLYTKNGNVYNFVPNSTKTGIKTEYNYRQVNDYYIAIAVSSISGTEVLNPNNINKYLTITSSSKLNELYNIVNGVEGTQTPYTETHPININDLEMNSNIKDLVVNNGELSFNPNGQMWGVVGSAKENITIETKFTGAAIGGFIAIGEDETTYYAIRLYGGKGSLYKFDKLLNQGGVPSEANYFEVNTLWNGLTIGTKIKIEKIGNTLKIHSLTSSGYSEIVEYNQCNFVGVINSDAINNPMNDTQVTLTHKLGAKGIIERVAELEKNIDDVSKEISILFVGNSLTQDGIAYLPYLLKKYFPEVKFKFYMWYNGGYNLAQQYEAFENNTPCGIFSVAENTSEWTNSQKTMSNILSTYKFDIVCMQEYFNYKESYTENDLTDWNNCQNYIVSNYTGGNALKFISLLHAPKRDVAESVFNLTESGNGLILKKTISEDLIPIGIAVYRALSTDLDELGDQGHLSPDGTHTQEGLPCLLQTYVALLWILNKLNINKSIYGCDFRMTTDIYNSINVPGPNLGSGVITGTDAQNILAQEIAIKAFKEGKKFVIDNLSNY